MCYLSCVSEPSTTFQRMATAGQVKLAKGNFTETLASLEPLRARPGEKMLSEVLQEMRDEERW